MQKNLDGFVKSVPKWSKEGLLEHIIDFVVSDDQPFRIVEKSSFRALLTYQRPAMNDSDIPHRTKLREEIVYKAEVAIDRLKEHFKTIPGKISITFDAWTSKAYDPFLAITAHYIDSPKDQPREWQLKSKVLAFEALKGRHTGANMATTISEVLDQYEINDKLGWVTADNANANDKALRVLDKKLNGGSVFLKKWKARDRRIRCSGSSLYVGFIT
ncbi:hypothetical protein CVT26_005196 [Gymnopilus dilepis]|uniref:hAT-like transposase RNase-H fold domain-containing protein n=1 Tax=Gymnopilus dilepis TaxID=231916 RepID=A0A409X2U0_9AGAR|nr:hypothetical protein CVT26_005196 [Gymnopilus dilepis]